MRTEYQYLVFVQKESSGKTTKWDCWNKKSREEVGSNPLGEVKWHSSWRQYCYFPLVQAVYSSGCLNDISDFINELNRR